MALIVDRSQSYLKILSDLSNFVATKTDAEAWKDFYDSSVGKTILELHAGLGEFNSFHAIMSRRESYLQDAEIRSSCIGIAETLGYAVHRGNNDHLAITFIADQNASISKYTIVGSCAGFDVVSLEDLAVEFGHEYTLLVALGNLKQEKITVQSSNINIFRFISPNVTEDILLYLNDTIVPFERELLQLINDNFVVLTNAWGSIDVFYINRFPPSDWSPSTRYTFTDFILPNYKWRPGREYKVGDKVYPTKNKDFYFEAVTDGISAFEEPNWPVTIGTGVNDGPSLIWKNKGPQNTQFYFRNVTPGIGISGMQEPNWPMQSGIQISDGDLTWVCTDVYDYSKYAYKSGDILTLKFIESADINYRNSDVDLFYGNIQGIEKEASYQDPESIESIKINAPLFHETKHVIRGREDYKKIFKEVEPTIVNTNGHDISPAVVELFYVKDHTTDLWERDKIVNRFDTIMPSTPNNFIYQATVGGRVGLSTKGNSSLTEPTWPTIPLDTFVDGQVVWQTKLLIGTIVNWESNKEYVLGDVVQPPVPNGYMYVAVDFKTEPVWPTTVGETVQDNEVIWECTEDIYLKGFTATYRRHNTNYTVGDLVVPVVPSGYYYMATTTGTSGNTEPIWPTVIGNNVTDGTVIWTCVDLTSADKYLKNRILELLSSYRPFGVMPPVINDPKILFIILDIELTLDITNVSINVIKKDVDSTLEQYERILGNSFSLKDVEKELEKLSYVKIARVLVNFENKTKIWSNGLLVKLNDLVFPPSSTGRMYEMVQVFDNKDSDYTQWLDRAYSLKVEPVWPMINGNTVDDGNLRWECQDETNPLPALWQADLIYTVGQAVRPTIPNGKQYVVTEILNTDPAWPTTIGEVVNDSKLFWVCRDPITYPPRCAWDEYYIIGRIINIVS